MLWSWPKDILFEGSAGLIYRKVIRLPWEKWFAWRPVKIHGGYVWLETVYRRTTICYVDIDDWKEVEYATLFDLLKEPE